MHKPTIGLGLILLVAGCQEIKVSDSDIPVIREPEVVQAIGQHRTVIVDARKPEDYAAGHIPNAINIFLPDIREKDARLAEAKRIIVYAGGVRDPLSIAAAKRLVASGYVNVWEFKGGIEQWKGSGHKLVGTLPEAEVRPDTAK
jgi:rhodanese-related sulfurtransferase